MFVYLQIVGHVPRQPLTFGLFDINMVIDIFSAVSPYWFPDIAVYDKVVGRSVQNW